MRYRSLALAVLLVLPSLAAFEERAAYGSRYPFALPAAPAALRFGLMRVSSHPYPWPLRPVWRQHAIRGGFGDPRFGTLGRSFHFGIDIPAPGGTPVYAVAGGTVFRAPDRVAVLRTIAARHESGFTYWHIIAAVQEHAAVHAGQLLGWVKLFWGHLHFAELENGVWVNPLRPSALTPFRNDARPQIDAVAATPLDDDVAPALSITLDAFVPPPTPLRAPWSGARLAPSLVRWRLLDGSVPISEWATALDFRTTIPPNAAYAEVYAPTATPNKAYVPGGYTIYLARGWRGAADVPPGTQIEVQVAGARDPIVATRIFPFPSAEPTREP